MAIGPNQPRSSVGDSTPQEVNDTSSPNGDNKTGDQSPSKSNDSNNDSVGTTAE
jgi:hypothetical protein